MDRFIKLNKVSASTLPANILVLLSKYSILLREQTTLSIRISSLDVFKDVHNTSRMTDNIEIRRIHRRLLIEVNRHLVNQSMQTIDQRNNLQELDIEAAENDTLSQVSSLSF